MDLENCWIQTHSGKKFYLLDPNPEDVLLEDISHALSMQCRFTGHTKFFYSVAQHSVLVSLYCEKENALYGLLHDASEAYLSDIASPIKKTLNLNGYKDIERKLQSAIYKKFNLKDEEPYNVKEIDLRMLVTEANNLMAPLHKDWRNPVEGFNFEITEKTPKQAKQYFLNRFWELQGVKI